MMVQYVVLVFICLVYVMSRFTQNCMRISSYNCQSSKRNVGGIQLLCNHSDIIFLQEHWLFPTDLPSLNMIHTDFMSFGISSMNVADGIVLGRPYGGVAVMWRKSLASKVKPVLFDDDRIIGLECVFDNIRLLLLGVYLPYNCNENFEDFLFSLGKIRTIMDEFDSPYVCVFGDFNADLEKQTSFGKELISFCQESDLVIADPMFLQRGSVTHVNDGHGTGSWLDHLVCTKGALDIIHSIDICYSIASSDHFPMSAIFAFPDDAVSVALHGQVDDNAKWVVDWSSVDQRRLLMYSEGVEERLSAIHVPLDVLDCDENHCEEHIEAIEQFYMGIISCLNYSSRSNLAKRVKGHKSVPGWSEFVQKAHSTLGDIYCLWALVGKPRDGYIYRQLRLAKTRFKYSLRWCVRNEKNLRAKSLADKLAKYPRDAGSFWKEVKKLNSSPPLASSVGGVSGAEGIGQLWKNHFSGILNSVQDQSLKSSVLSKLTIDDLGAMPGISVQEVYDAIAYLSSGRSSGHDGLNAEHFKFAGHLCATHLSLCFTMMLRHGYLPSELTKVILVPILKDKTGNISEKDNYRPIALASASSKILETIILNCSKEILQTSDHQFGFKSAHSTDMAIYAVKEISDYYLRNNSPVYLCYLDARKAFDRVNHWKLFDKLLKKGMNANLVRLLVKWYRSQLFHIQWGQCVTDGFTVSNGVRQGGILSPFLYNFYTNSLSNALDRTGVGCRYLGSMNHIAYADDMVLLSPSPFGLQTLLNTCDRFAKDHDIVYNTKKTVCMVMRPKTLKNLMQPRFTLCGTILTFVNEYKYLGFRMSDKSCDNSEIQQQYRMLCCRTNSLIRKFSMCSYSVKRFLFTTYCATVYCVQLWRVYTVSVLKKFKVCLNNAARIFFGYPRFCSASAMYVSECIDNYDVMFRKAAWGFIQRLRSSDNCIINSLVDSDLGSRSALRATWDRALMSH